MVDKAKAKMNVEFSESLLADNHDMHITPEDFE